MRQEPIERQDALKLVRAKKPKKVLKEILKPYLREVEYIKPYFEEKYVGQELSFSPYGSGQVVSIVVNNRYHVPAGLGVVISHYGEKDNQTMTLHLDDVLGGQRMYHKDNFVTVHFRHTTSMLSWDDYVLRFTLDTFKTSALELTGYNDAGSLRARIWGSCKLLSVERSEGERSVLAEMMKKNRIQGHLSPEAQEAETHAGEG